MFAYKTTETINDFLTSEAPSDPFVGEGVALFSSGLEARSTDAFSGDGAELFSSGLVQLFSSGLSPKASGLRIVEGDGVEMFSSGL
ncbi:hypothetical protein BXY66_1766 [Shimia isoporae]|uniref:Uncharacterized protein n=1 Tax=Shimia isoporae TaxID=647720 RepID=A0A4R1NPD7_9RHOB|nr:DUF6749 family protein [Shimia isoporae]TCL09709.1 hypothetical protein BXY66_1766 [Shimia isoporae]